MGVSGLEAGRAEDFAESGCQLAGLGGLDVDFGIASEVSGGDESVALADLPAAFEEAVIGGECVFGGGIGAVVDEYDSVEAGNEKQYAEEHSGSEVAFRTWGGLGGWGLSTGEIVVGHAVVPPAEESQASLLERPDCPGEKLRFLRGTLFVSQFWQPKGVSSSEMRLPRPRASRP